MKRTAETLRGWDGKYHRWCFMLDGKRVRVTCKELGLPIDQWTQEASRKTAWSWLVAHQHGEKMETLPGLIQVFQREVERIQSEYPNVVGTVQELTKKHLRLAVEGIRWDIKPIARHQWERERRLDVEIPPGLRDEYGPIAVTVAPEAMVNAIAQVPIENPVVPETETTGNLIQRDQDDSEDEDNDERYTARFQDEVNRVEDLIDEHMLRLPDFALVFEMKKQQLEEMNDNPTSFKKLIQFKSKLEEDVEDIENFDPSFDDELKNPVAPGNDPETTGDFSHR